jgi:hypothetical protein
MPAGSPAVTQLPNFAIDKSSQVTAAGVEVKNNWSQLGPVCDDDGNCLRRLPIGTVWPRER